MKLLLIAALIGLSTGALLHTSPRQLADTAEHAMGWVCRMTYNRDGGVESSNTRWAHGGESALPDLASHASVSPRNPTLPGRAARVVSKRESRFSARPVTTLFLRMLGLPRLRATPVELRP